MTRLGKSHGAQIWCLGGNRSPSNPPICQSAMKEPPPALPPGITDHSSAGRREAGPEPGFPENLNQDTCIQESQSPPIPANLVVDLRHLFL